MTNFTKLLYRVLLTCLLLVNAIEMLFAQALPSGRVAASTAVSRQAPNKNVQWAGDAIRKTTIADITIAAHNPFEAGSAKAMDMQNKWITPVNSESQAVFKGLLSNPVNNKYAPSFTGNFKTTGGNGGGTGKKPEWKVQTQPEIEFGNKHVYLDYTVVNSGGTVIGNYTAAPVKNEYAVNCPVGTKVDKKSVRDYYNSANASLRVIRDCRVEHNDNTNYSFTQCICGHTAGCQMAVKISVPLVITCLVTEEKITYPISWEQDTNGSPSYDGQNISDVSRAAADENNQLAKSHEEDHQNDGKTYITNINTVNSTEHKLYDWSVVIEVCAGTRAGSEAMAVDSINGILPLVEKDKYDDTLDLFLTTLKNLDRTRDNEVLNHIGVDPARFWNENKVITIPNGKWELWGKTFLHKDITPNPAP